MVRATAFPPLPGGLWLKYTRNGVFPTPRLVKGSREFYGCWYKKRHFFPCAAPGAYPIITRYVFIDKNFGFLYDYLYALFRVQRANWPNQNKPTQAQALLAQASGARRLIPRAYLENSGQAALARLYGEYFLWKKQKTSFYYCCAAWYAAAFLWGAFWEWAPVSIIFIAKPPLN